MHRASSWFDTGLSAGASISLNLRGSNCRSGRSHCSNYGNERGINNSAEEQRLDAGKNSKYQELERSDHAIYVNTGMSRILYLIQQR
jgi:hypothetical protein